MTRENLEAEKVKANATYVATLYAYDDACQVLKGAIAAFNRTHAAFNEANDRYWKIQRALEALGASRAC